MPDVFTQEAYIRWGIMDKRGMIYAKAADQGVTFILCLSDASTIT
jgi:hypothetical protein